MLFQRKADCPAQSPETDEPIEGSDAAAAESKVTPACQGSVPTPAPASIIGNGTCEYYQWRYDDFIKRHQGCDHKQPPEYYLNYGDKYCTRFTDELYYKLGPRGKEWLVKARRILQQDIERVLKENPDIELDNEAFKKAAFGTHPDAYWEAGFKELSLVDVIYLNFSIDDADYWTFDTGKQVLSVTALTVNNAVYDLSRGQFLENYYKTLFDNAFYNENISPFSRLFRYMGDIMKLILLPGMPTQLSSDLSKRVDDEFLKLFNHTQSNDAN